MASRLTQEWQIISISRFLCSAPNLDMAISFATSVVVPRADRKRPCQFHTEKELWSGSNSGRWAINTSCYRLIGRTWCKNDWIRQPDRTVPNTIQTGNQFHPSVLLNGRWKHPNIGIHISYMIIISLCLNLVNLSILCLPALCAYGMATFGEGW